MGGVSRFCPQRSSVWAGWLTTPATTNCCFSQVGNFYRASFVSNFLANLQLFFVLKREQFFQKIKLEFVSFSF